MEHIFCQKIKIENQVGFASAKYTFEFRVYWLKIELRIPHMCIEMSLTYRLFLTMTFTFRTNIYIFFGGVGRRGYAFYGSWLVLAII